MCVYLCVRARIFFKRVVTRIISPILPLFSHATRKIGVQRRLSAYDTIRNSTQEDNLEKIVAQGKVGGPRSRGRYTRMDRLNSKKNKLNAVKLQSIGEAEDRTGWNELQDRIQH